MAHRREVPAKLEASRRPEAKTLDPQRQLTLEEMGFIVLRFRNADVGQHPNTVLESIRRCLKPRR